MEVLIGFVDLTQEMFTPGNAYLKKNIENRQTKQQFVLCKVPQGRVRKHN